jgi:predicted metal-binding membrane protein
LVPALAARGQGAGRLQPDLLVWLGVIAAAWTAAYWLEVSGTAHILHHHTIYHSGRVVAGGLALLGTWQVMTAAMMLPGALPAVRRIAPATAQVIFLGVYFVAWTGFALVAFVGDMGLHSLVHGWLPAAQHENLIPAAVLAVAAAYQVSPWKRASLGACRRPVTILARYQRGGLIDGLEAGITYSRHCLVSGWALMLIMFSAGVADLFWMIVLALTMLGEKTLPSGDNVRYAVATALALLAAGALVSGSPFPT